MSTYYNVGRKEIDKMRFDIMSGEEILARSAAKMYPYGIDSTVLYDGIKPKKGGLLDPALGPWDNYSQCDTCGLTMARCIGHSAHIELTEDVHHIELLKFLPKILSCLCLRCCKLRISKSDTEIKEMLKSNKKPKQRFAEIKNLVKSSNYCSRPNSGCGTPAPKIKIVPKKSSSTVEIIAETDMKHLTNEEGIHVEKKKKISQILTPKMIKHILKQIPDNDLRLMGLDPAHRPDNFIITNLLVPPVQIRPSVKMEGLQSATQEDQLTHSLINIVKVNYRIREHKDSNNEQNVKFISEHSHLLQLYVATYMNNETSLFPPSEQKNVAMKSVAARLKSKTGRIRNNLMGKRVDYSGRSVITSDTNLGIDELGVPIKEAMTITIPETVTPHNYDRMVKLVKNGRYNYPGANKVQIARKVNNEDGTLESIDLRKRKNVPLKYGDIVHRHMVNGDYVLFNRQPSLHKMSMMGHRARIFNNNAFASFRINECVCEPYNAD
jgi:DNA-directed RNA polymerase II subunit RPB1